MQIKLSGYHFVKFQRYDYLRVGMESRDEFVSIHISRQRFEEALKTIKSTDRLKMGKQSLYEEQKHVFTYDLLTLKLNLKIYSFGLSNKNYFT